MALVKLPSSSPLALQPWSGRGGGCCLWFSGIFVLFFVPPPPFFNSIWNQKAVDSGKNDPCALPPLSPALVPCFPMALYPKHHPTDGGPAPFPAFVSPQIPLAGEGRRGKGRGPAPSSGIWEGPAPMGFTLSYGLSPRHIC